MEVSVQIKLVQALWNMVSIEVYQQYDSRAKALGILSLIASKDISLSLNTDRAALILRYMSNNKPEPLIVEALKCISFLSMQVCLYPFEFVSFFNY